MNNYIIAKRHKPRLLVIEDNPDQYFLTKWALENRFPEVEPIWKATAEDAWQYLEEQTESDSQLPVLILLDLYLPERVNAWALLEAIKTHHRYRAIPVIMLSSSNESEDITESYFLRSNAYMVKPGLEADWLTNIDQFRQYWWSAVTLTP